MSSIAAQSAAGKIWLPEINIVRGFAILSVILIHVAANFNGTGVITLLVLVNMVADAVLHFAVPLFVLISGLVLSLARWKIGESINFYKKRFRSVIPQYVIFSIIYILLPALVIEASISTTGAIGKLLTGNAWLHLWYIPLIIELYLLYPMLIRLYDHFEKTGRIWAYLLSALIIQITFPFIRVLTNTVDVEDMDGLFNLVSFPGYIFYFIAGIYAGRNIGAIRDKIATMHVSLFAFIAAVSALIVPLYFSTRYFGVPAGLSINAAFILWGLAMLPLTIAVFVLFFKLASLSAFKDSRIGHSVDEMGTYAFGIYLVHPLFILVFKSGFINVLGIGVDSAMFYLLLAIFTTVSSYIFVKVASMLPYGDWIVGIKYPKAGVSMRKGSGRSPNP